MMTERIAIPGGGIFVRPAMELDDEHGLSWKLRYAPDTLTRADELVLAEIVSAYGYLLIETTQKRRDLICKTVREAVINA